MNKKYLFIGLYMILIFSFNIKRTPFLCPAYGDVNTFAEEICIPIGHITCITCATTSLTTYMKNGEDNRTGLYITWKDYPWLFFVVLLNVVYFLRKVILATYGYGVDFIDWGKDFKRLNEISQKVSGNKRIVFRIINYLVPISLMLGLILCIWAHGG